MNLIPEARQWWRMWSVRFLGAALFIDGLSLLPLVGYLPDSVADAYPVLDKIQMALIALALLARFIKQGRLHDG